MFKRMMVFGFVFLFLASVVSAQPPRMDVKGRQPKFFGDVDRLEKPNADRQRMEQERGPWGMPGEFRQHAPGKFGWGPGKNKYGGPQYGMKGFGGGPFKPFTDNNPWGRIDSGPVGPQCPFWGKVPTDNYNRGGQGRQHKGYQGGRNKEFQPPQRGLGVDNKNGSVKKVCPFCGK